MTAIEWILFFAKFGLAFIGLSLIPVMIFLERKGAAVIQDRPGPNRANLEGLWFLPAWARRIRGFGMVHNLTDAVKLFFKEDFVPKHAHKWFYLLAPAIPVITAILTPAVIPFFAPLVFEGASAPVSGAIVDANSGLLLLFAFGAVSVYGTVLGSWGSNSKYSLLGGLRSSAMMISYEISMGLGILGLILIVGSFSLSEIVAWQEAHTWGLVVQPVGFLLFVVSMFAETNRTPFDVAESEELVGGFHTEYSAIRFALFFMGEYAHVVIASLLIATLFCGGWSLLPLPGWGAEMITSHLGIVIGVVCLFKIVLFMLIARLIKQQRRRYAKMNASDRDAKLAEYSLFKFVFLAFAVGAALVAVVAFVWPPLRTPEA
ncbi:MAG: NADH-quinone oxidoreductase subunit H, partial [Planctomycetota bacterium]|nr:NADH-quinone oxidoreductase subunit H [Planctomycetota bacterium]